MNASESALSQVLLRHGKGGCQEAVGQLLVHFRNYLALLARLQVGRRLQGKVAASDLVQETPSGPTATRGQRAEGGRA